MNLSNAQSKVREFMETFGQECPRLASVPSAAIQELRESLITEEAEEFARDKGTLVGAADAIGDLLYVAIGAAVAYGIEIEPIFDEIHWSNMSKLWTAREVSDEMSNDFDFHNKYDIKAFCVGSSRNVLVKRKDGKVVKSPSYSPANLGPILEAQV
jgi:predicted HAD superfamily Cof-like phosphohydrolase